MNYSLITNEHWKTMNEKSKLVAIQSILTTWKLSGRRIKYDSKWFLREVETSILDEDGMNLGKRISLIAIGSNAFGDSDEIINRLVSKLTEDDKQKHLYVENKVKEYKKEKNQEYISDSAFDEIINKCAKDFNILEKEMFDIWDRVGKAYLGIEM